MIRLFFNGFQIKKQKRNFEVLLVYQKHTTMATDKKIKAKEDAAKDLQELFEDGLKDIYWAEKALSKALPKMEKNATSAALKDAIKSHLEETKTHITRLEEAFKSIGQKAEAEKCDAMEGLLEEGEGIMEETEPGVVRDAGIIAAAQKVEHYEIATYGTLAAFAKVLGHKDALKLLLETLEEEKACDEKLTGIADTNLNSKAK
jgi:ferritin-like metal-binding protein YciE